MKVPFERIIIDKKAQRDELTGRIIERLPGIPFEYENDLPRLIAERPAKDRSLILTHHSGEFVKDFPSTPGTPPCGEKYIITMLNCPFTCSYCYLQSYLEHGRIVVFTNLKKMKSDIRKALDRPDVLRITTGEMGDSLALDHITGVTLDILPLFSGSKTLLEARTKSANTGHIIEGTKNRPGLLDNLLITWTLAPSAAIRKEERMVSSLEERMAAIAEASAAGINTAVRFDPVIPWYYRKEEYERLVEMIADSVGRGSILRFEIGVMRFPPGLWEEAGKVSSALFKGEYFRDREGKMRLYRPERIRIYRDIYQSIRRYFPETRVDLSMEDSEVWEDTGIPT
ncbi:MAG: hypothetical protein JW746_01710 [Candidatus Krumholzibacteriota bacterium]|nr:hypothetical protein [Candidatus Krumholzibacteriota bacterium]